MAEDEFDFAGQNPAAHLPVDRNAVPFDYEARLRQGGYTKTSPSSLDGLFKALATPYVPKRVVQLPPKIVRRIRLREVLLPGFGIMIAHFILFVFVLAIYLLFVGFLGIAVPAIALLNVEVKTHLVPGATCTITDTYVTSSTSDDGTSYYAHVDFTLSTPDGASYQTDEYWTSSYDDEASARHYTSRYKVNASYQCYYDSAAPYFASFSKQEAGFWDYFWLPWAAVLFLVLGVLPNLWLLRIALRFPINILRGRTKIVW